MIPDPLVSVIITTYYRNERLARAIESIRSQTHDNIELIVVDGSGEAHAESVVDDDILYIAQSEDRGAHAARADGAKVAAGDFIQFVDDDDVLRPRKIELQLDKLRHEDDVGVVYCGVENEFGDLALPRPDARGDVLELALKFDLLPCNTTTMLIEADLITELLPFPNRHGADDIGMKIELAKRTRFDFIDKPLVLRGEPDYRLGTTWQSVDGRREILTRYEALYNEFPDFVRRKAMANVYETEGQRYVEDNFWSFRAIVAYYNMIQTEPTPSAKQWGQFIGSFFGRSSFLLFRWIWRLTNRYHVMKPNAVNVE